MSTIKQILLSIGVLVVAGGAWLAYDHEALFSLPFVGAANTPGAGPAPGPGTPAARGFQGGPPGGFPGGGAPGGGFAGGGPPGGGSGASRSASPVLAAMVELDDDGFTVEAIGTVAAAQAVTIYPQVTGVVTEISFRPGTHVNAGDALVLLADGDQQIALERATVAVQSAQAALDRAEQLAANNNITTVALDDARAAVTRAEIDRRSAELELEKRTVRAPFAGVIGLTDLSVGDLVSSSKAVATLDDTSTVLVSFYVPERASGRVEIDQTVTATTEALVGRSFVGAISAVDSRVDPVARTLKVQVTLPNDASDLKPGMALVVSLAFPGNLYPVVPSLAVQYDRNGAYVFRIDDNVVRRVGVDIIGRRSGTIIVVADLVAGNLVVSEGLQRLREGTQVTILNDPSLSEPGSASPAAPDDVPLAGDAAPARPGALRGAAPASTVLGEPGVAGAGTPPGGAANGEPARLPQSGFRAGGAALPG